MPRGQVLEPEEGVPVAGAAPTWVVLHDLIEETNTHNALVRFPQRKGSKWEKGTALRSKALRNYFCSVSLPKKGTSAVILLIILFYS